MPSPPTENRQRTFLELQYHGRSPFVTLLHLFRGDQLRLLIALVFFIIKHSPTWVLPIIVGNIINLLGDENGQLTTLWLNGGVMAVLILQNVPTHYIYTRNISACIRDIEARLRSALVVRLQQLSIAFHDNSHAGRIQSKIIRDVEAITTLCQSSIDVCISAFVGITVALTVTLMRNPEIVFIYLVAVPLAVGLARSFRGRMQDRNREFRDSIERISGRIAEMIAMIPISRAHGVEEQEVRDINRRLEKVKTKGMKLDLLTALFAAMAWTAFQMVSISCLMVTAYMAFIGRIGVGDVVMYQSFFGMIVGSVQMLLTFYPQLTRGFESIHSLGEILECPDIERNAGKQVVPYVRGAFQFENVSFHYDSPVNPALIDVNLNVSAGECIAVVGGSGSGKSTLMSLIIGFHRPVSGIIRLDGTDMEQLDLRTYRRYLSIVPQNILLFSGTIRDNITHGLSSVSDEQVQGAVDIANMNEFVERLPDGLNTVLGEHGGKLSGGQRQRVAIARAVIRDPRVIIFDEATSALDTASEALVQDAIAKMIAGRTTFIVAHRLSTIRRADRIVVMKQGRVVEIGTDDELMRKQGEYHHLKTLQT